MKLHTEEVTFKPVTFTLESPDELRVFLALLCNYQGSRCPTVLIESEHEVLCDSRGKMKFTEHEISVIMDKMLSQENYVLLRDMLRKLS